MRSVFLTFSLIAVVAFMGCSNSSAPSMPDETSADLPSWSADIDGNDYVFGPGDLRSDRQLAVVNPGSNMSAMELRQYFAVVITQTSFPPYMWHMVYNFYVFPTLMQQPDAVVFSWVPAVEANGWDVPDGPPPPAL